MSVFKAIILGIVQGLTEFLPISSSGHLSVFQYFMGASGEESLLMTVLLHIGTLLAVFICFRKTIADLILEAVSMVMDIIHKKFSFKELNDKRKMIFYFMLSCVPLLFLLLPVGNGQNIMDKLEVFSQDKSILAEGICFLVTGALLILATLRAQKIKRFYKMNFLFAFIVGVAQMAAAAFPGISRSGSTISSGMLCGVRKSYMIQYSFILGIPAILAANIVKIGDAVSSGTELGFLPAFMGIIFSTIFGILAIKLLYVIMKKDWFKYFGWYCVAMGSFCMIVSLIKAF